MMLPALACALGLLLADSRSAASEAEPASLSKIVKPLTGVAAYRAAMRTEASLTSYFPFDDGSARDVTSTNHGTLVQPAGFRPGLREGPNQALVLSGGHVNFGYAKAFDLRDLSEIRTIELLLRADWTTDPGYDPTILSAQNHNQVRYCIRMRKTKDAIDFWNGSERYSFTIPPAADDWHHLAVVIYRGRCSV